MRKDRPGPPLRKVSWALGAIVWLMVMLVGIATVATQLKQDRHYASITQQK